MDVYYSHAIPLYGTRLEKFEIQFIEKNIPKANIIDPGSFQDNLEKRLGGMDYCLKLVEKCDGLVFSKFLGKITAGIGKEINHALSKKIPVYELKKGRLSKISKKVAYLSREETVLFYRKIALFRKLLSP